MSNDRFMSTAIAALVLLTGVATPAWADRDDRDRKRPDKEYKSKERSEPRAPRQTRPPATRPKAP